MKLFFALMMFLSVCFCLCADNKADFVPATGTFDVPETSPDMVIIANSMTVVDGQAILERNVRATRSTDVLTSQHLLLNDEPRWVLATEDPELIRNERIDESGVFRNTHLVADRIYFNAEKEYFNASESVFLKIVETPFQARSSQEESSWVEIKSDEMFWYSEDELLKFTGNVSVRDSDSFATSDKLDYYQDKSIAILTGNARVETVEFNERTGEMEDRILEGEKITYNTETRIATSE